MGQSFSSPPPSKEDVLRIVKHQLPEIVQFNGTKSGVLIAVTPTLYSAQIRRSAGDLGQQLFHALSDSTPPSGGVLPKDAIVVGKVEQKKEVLDELSTLAKKTEKDGLLLFYFVGAAVAVPTDLGEKASLALGFKHEENTTIDAEELAAVLKNTKARHIVLILECSGNGAAFSARLEHDAAAAKFAEHVTIAAVLATGEYALFYEEVGCGAFTYFFKETLARFSEAGCIRLREAVEESLRLSGAFAGLVYHASVGGCVASPPAIEFSDVQLALKQFKKFKGSVRERDGGRDVPDVGSPANR